MNGLPGRVWQGTITVNPGQEFQVVVSRETSFGPYSSANGERTGYRDITTGEFYGGISQTPVPGSGNGGVGGMEGVAGRYYGVSAPGLDTWNGYHDWWIATSYPTQGQPGTAGSTGCAIIYWENPEVIEDE